MNTEKIRKAVAESAETCGADGYEIDIDCGVSAGAEALKNEISSVSYVRTDSITVRCVKNGKSGYASSELVTPEAAAELVRRACENALVVDDEDEVPLFPGSDKYENVEEPAEELPSAEEMKAHTLELQKKVYEASDKVVDGTQSLTSCGYSENVFMNSAGLNLSYKSSIVYHGVVVAVKDGDNAEEDYEDALVGTESVEGTVNRAVSASLSKLGGDAVPSGKYNVVMDSNTVRELLATFSPVFSARSAFLKTTLYADKEGQKVASDILTVTDDPFHPKKYGKCPFDAEGVAVYKKNVIENGVLKTLLYNRMYAKKFGKETTGNASGAKTVSPKGLYVEAGDLTKDELLAKLENGLYITELKGLHAGANIQSGDFSLEAEGFLVVDGKKTSPVKNITVADNFYELLKKVTALSNEVEFGTVSKYGAPDVLFSEISVSGK